MSPHRAVLVKMAKRYGWVRGAELGVDKGLLFEQLLAGVPGLHLTGVDVFPIPVRLARCEAIAAAYPERARLLKMTTVEAAALIPDGSLDFVFIDADHGYASVREDIQHWTPKVRTGGWLGGHDYNRKWPGVVQAVDEAFPRVKVYPGSIWGVWR